MHSRPRLLVVDDERPILTLVERFARLQGFDVVTAGGGPETLAQLRPGLADVALVDLRMPGVDGLGVLDAIRSTDPACQVILMTGDPSVETAVYAVKAGALDYLSKPFDFDRLGSLLASIRGDIDRRRAVFNAEGDLARRLEFCGMIGRSAVMQELFATMRRVATHVRTALVTGETGVGKELVCAALHSLGPRAARRMVTINCSAVVEPLFESELFGHSRGSFTGAVTDKRGLFEQADGGTLVLDEIGELPLAAQAKLLRVLETGELLRVGALAPVRVDVRVIAATNRDLHAECQAGRFRSDLYYRLNLMPLRVPALRDRIEDVPYLTAAFVREFAERFGKPIDGLTPGAERILQNWHWPGNVRELRNTIERGCLTADRECLTERDIGLSLQAGAPATTRPVRGAPSGRRLHDLERDEIARVLAACRGNKAAAARQLGLDRRSLYRRLEKFGLAAPRDHDDGSGVANVAGSRALGGQEQRG